jgi:hypothetical protein
MQLKFKHTFAIAVLSGSIAFTGCRKEETTEVIPTIAATAAGPTYLPVGTVLEGSAKGAKNAASTSNIPVSSVATLGYSSYYGNVMVVVSPNNQYRVYMQNDGNMVLYKYTSTPASAIWATNTGNTSARDVYFGNNGNIALFSVQGYEIWNAGSGQAGPDRAWVLQDDGNFVGYPVDYSVIGNNYTITGAPFADTGTWGGQKSKYFGKVKVL